MVHVVFWSNGNRGSRGGISLLMVFVGGAGAGEGSAFGAEGKRETDVDDARM